MTTNVSASPDSQVGGVRTGTVYVSLSLVRMEVRALYPAALQWDTSARVNLDILGQTVKEVCPVGSCPATMEGAVHSLQGERVAPAYLVTVGPSVSIAAKKAVLPSLAIMEGYVLKRPAFRSSIASVPVVGQVSGVSRAAETLSSQHPRAPLQTVTAKPVMVFVTRNATHLPVVGTVVTALLLLILGHVVQTLAAGVSSTTASVMNPATMLTVSMTTLTAKARKKCATPYMKPTVLITMLMDDVTRAVTQRSVAGMAWTVQRMFQRTSLMVL